MLPNRANQKSIEANSNIIRRIHSISTIKEWHPKTQQCRQLRKMSKLKSWSINRPSKLLRNNELMSQSQSKTLIGSKTSINLTELHMALITVIKVIYCQYEFLMKTQIRKKRKELVPSMSKCDKTLVSSQECSVYNYRIVLKITQENKTGMNFSNWSLREYQTQS